MDQSIAESGGGEDATKSNYIRVRVQRLREKAECDAERELEANSLRLPALKRDALAGKAITCLHCGHYGRVKREAQGSAGICILLMFIGMIPGMIYWALYGGYRYVCPRCHVVYGKDAPRAS